LFALRTVKKMFSYRIIILELLEKYVKLYRKIFYEWYTLAGCPNKTNKVIELFKPQTSLREPSNRAMRGELVLANPQLRKAA
ncbi:MAG: hypothetical protein ACREHC_01850, partial [Candidatus Levyibacteriota bacterium]